MNELPDVIEFVRSHPPFDDLDDQTLGALCSKIQVSYARRGSELLEFGAANAELYLVRRGAVGLYDAAGSLVEKRAEGEVFGYPSLLTGQSTRFGARAEEDTLLYHLDGDTFRTLRANNPDFDRFFSAALLKRVESGLSRSTGSLVSARRVRDLMSSPAITAPDTVTVAAACELMSQHGVSALPITRDGALVGIFTDRDLRNRVAAQNQPLTTPIVRVMTPEPTAIAPDDTGFDAQLKMAEVGVHHLPVVADDALAGLVTLSDLVTEFEDEPVHFIGALRRQKTAAAVVAKARRRNELFIKLVHSGLSAAETERVMTGVTDVTTRRLLHLASEELGPAPLRFAWLAFGSEARAEQTIRTDQDNGLITERQPNAREAIWFANLADFVCQHLNDAGYVFCPGGIMAKNEQWRRSLAGWQQTFFDWIDKPEPKALMFASIFFDMRAIAGDDALVAELKKTVFERAAKNSIFLRFMAQNALSFRPPVSFFRHFILEADGEHGEGLNLKQRGVVPIVSLARMRALELGIEAPATGDRLIQVGARLPGLRADMDSLRDALELIGRIRHQHQADSLKRGEVPTNLVGPADLSPLTRRHLKAAFLMVRDGQQGLAQRYSTG